MKNTVINLLFVWQSIDFICTLEIPAVDKAISDYDQFNNQIKIAGLENSIFIQLEQIFPGLELIEANDQYPTTNFSHNISHIVKNIDVDNIIISSDSIKNLGRLKQQIDYLNMIKLAEIGLDTQYKKTIKIKNHEYIVRTTSKLVNISQIRQYIQASIFIDDNNETFYLPKHFIKYVIQRASLVKNINLNDFYIGLGLEIFTNILNSIGIAIQLEGWSYASQKLTKQLKINMFNKNVNTYFLIPKDSVKFKQLIISKISMQLPQETVITSDNKLEFDIGFELCQMNIDKINQLETGNTILSAININQLQYSINFGKSILDATAISHTQLKINGLRHNEN